LLRKQTFEGGGEIWPSDGLKAPSDASQIPCRLITRGNGTGPAASQHHTITNCNMPSGFARNQPVGLTAQRSQHNACRFGISCVRVRPRARVRTISTMTPSNGPVTTRGNRETNQGADFLFLMVWWSWRQVRCCRTAKTPIH